MATITTWDDVQPGNTIRVDKIGSRRPFLMVVTKVERDGGGWAFVIGRRLTLSGQPTRLRTSNGCRPGERRELVHIDDVTEETTP